MRVFATLEASDVEHAGQPVRRVGPAGREPDLTFHTTDFEALREGSHRSRTLRWRDLRFRAHPPRNPFAPPVGVVEASRPLACGSVGHPIERAARVPLALPGTWVFLLGDEDESWIGGELVVFLADAPAEPQIERVVVSVHEQLPVLANELAEQAAADRSVRARP
jgi:hypothetical protein